MNYFIVPKDISEMEYFHDRNALQVLILLLSEVNEVGRVVFSFEHISLLTHLPTTEVKRCIFFLEKYGRIEVSRIEKKRPQVKQLYFIEVIEDNL